MHLNLFYCCVIFVIEERTLVQIIAAKLEILISFQKKNKPLTPKTPHTVHYQQWKKAGLESIDSVWDYSEGKLSV